jgi:hypothetical protein
LEGWYVRFMMVLQATKSSLSAKLQVLRFAILAAVQHSQLCKSAKKPDTKGTLNKRQTGKPTRYESGKPMIIADFPTLATS